jgi:putative oxidoreductase
MFMKSFTAQTYALLRIVTGFLFLWHGTQKLFGFPTPMPMEAPDFIIYVAGPIELVGGFFVMIGLFTGWAAFVCSVLWQRPTGWLMVHRLYSPFSMVVNLQHYIVSFFYVFQLRVQASGAWTSSWEPPSEST